MSDQSKNTLSKWVYDYSDELFRFTLSRVPQKEEAEDIIQSTFFAAQQSLHQFDGRSSPKTWIFAILKNKIADHFRERFRQATVFSTTISSGAVPGEYFDQYRDWYQEQRPITWQEEPEHLLDDVHFNKVFQECIAELPARWQLAVQSKYIEDRDSHEICQELDISPSNYWQILHRAKSQLRYCLEQLWFKRG